MFVSVSGRFYRAVLAESCAEALGGSTAAGRYARPGQSALYMSASEEGVAAAMQVYPLPEGRRRRICRLQVEAHSIFDLRDDRACEWAGIRREDALAPWQELVAQDGEPPSWTVRARLEELGAHGLIDPSRRAEGLWHLVLFRWNVSGGSQVRLAE